MNDKLTRILLVEDRFEDAEIVKREVLKVIPDACFRLVETEKDFLRELGDFKPDLILSDYTMPEFDGITALQLALEHAPLIPVIIVTGSVNEDTAVECMKSGASNYVIKEQLRRLAPAVIHALEEKKDKEAKNAAEIALKKSEERFRNYIENAPDGFFVADETGRYLMVNEAACISTGYSRDELLSMGINDMVFPDDSETAFSKFQEVQETGHIITEIPYRTRDGKRRWWLVKAVKLGENQLLGFTHDITDQKIAEEAMKNSESRFRELFENAPMAYQSLNISGAYIDVNHELCNMLGYSEKELIGRNFGDYWVPESRELFPGKYNSFIEKGSVRAELELIRKDGTVISVLLEGRTQKDKEGHLIRTHCVLVDITARKKNEADLIAAKEKAEENDRLKTAFLNNISHEVRTPLNGIIGFGNLINDPATTAEERAYYIRIINQSSERLITVIQDIINISMIETGQEIVREGIFDVSALMKKTFDYYLPRTENKGLYFNFHPEFPDGGTMIKSDENKVSSVLTQLVGNAVKFTLKGRVEYGCRQEGKVLTFFVRDTGIGIDTDDQQQIFNRFWKISSIGGKFSEGTGLGLAICKAYIEMLNGKIWVESVPEQGSTFWFSIPYQPVQPDHVSDGVGEIIEIHDSGPAGTILIAEDEYDNFLFLEILLSKFKFNIIHVWNGLEAVERCEHSTEIDLVLMDMKMPVMDGLEASRKIKAIRPNLPVIAVTAYAMAGDKEKTLSQGCDAYLSKPLELELLIDLLKRYRLLK